MKVGGVGLHRGPSIASSGPNAHGLSVFNSGGGRMVRPLYLLMALGVAGIEARPAPHLR